MRSETHAFEHDNNAIYSKHASVRAKQRGIKRCDITELLRIGEQAGDKVVAAKRAINDRLAELKAEIKQIERLRGLVAVMPADQLITVYRQH